MGALVHSFYERTASVDIRLSSTVQAPHLLNDLVTERENDATLHVLVRAGRRLNQVSHSSGFIPFGGVMDTFVGKDQRWSLIFNLSYH